MKIFLSARYSRRDELRKYRSILEDMGHVVTSRWLNTTYEEKEREEQVYSSAAPPELVEEHGLQDIEDVLECDCFIAFTEPSRSNTRGGRHVEYGVAIAAKKRLIVIGYRENIFHHLPSAKFYESFRELFVNYLWNDSEEL